MGEWVDQRDKEEGIHCIICNKLCKNAYGLANHVAKTHRIRFSEYKKMLVANAEMEFDAIKDKHLKHLFELLKETWVDATWTPRA